MSALVDAARRWIGVPFRHRGRSRRGVDCVGLVVMAYSDAGIQLPDFRLYGREPHRDGMIRHMKVALGEPVAVAPVSSSHLQTGDVIAIRYLAEPHHAAVLGVRHYGGRPALTMIHAEGIHGAVLEQRLTPDVIDRITHVFRKPA